ncbi:MAG: methyltransferase protein [Ferruginibacter sp.]|nr:methyltransferase protein [Ferruginibacter sp.]
MLSLSKRSYKKELLDGADIPFADVQKNMEELNVINSLLGGHKITVDGVKKILQSFPVHQSIIICEIGCGGGDNLKAIEKYCNHHSINASFIGIDIKEDCIDFARQQYPTLNAQWIVSDYKEVNFTKQPPGIIFSSLFCHHFIEKDIVKMLRWMKENSSLGFFINDLHRHPLAYYSIKLITAIFSRSYLVKNDAPLSVVRGFKKREWQMINSEAGITGYSLQWKWAFRHLIVYVHQEMPLQVNKFANE